MGDDGSRHSSEFVGNSEDPEVQSPLKNQKGAEQNEGTKTGAGASRQLDLQAKEPGRTLPKKRKSKVTNVTVQTPDLNIPVTSNAIVPAGLVNSRVSQLDTSVESSGGSMIETLKKQKRGNNQNARSAASVNDCPRRAQ
jgi:hypothetical protein